jgi:hypothetical protein
MLHKSIDLLTSSKLNNNYKKHTAMLYKFTGGALDSFASFILIKI